MADKTSHSKLMHYIEQTPTITASAYATGDLIGSAAVEFTGAVPGDTNNSETLGGLLQSVIVTDLGKQSSSLDIVFFDVNPSNTTFTENSAFDPHDTDILNIVGTVAITDWKAFNDNSQGQAFNLAMPFILDSGNILYAAVVSRGAPTYASTTDLTIRLGIIAA